MRVIHEGQMKMAHQLPQFDHEEVIAVIRSTGQHHKELLHEICDVLHDQAMDVIHAEVPPHRTAAPRLHTVPPSAPYLHTVHTPCLYRWTPTAWARRSTRST